MNTIIYGGVKYKQIRHAVYCKNCRETVESIHEHDYVMCLCGSVGVDGGVYQGNRFIGKPEDMEIRGIYCAFVNGKQVWLPCSLVQGTKKIEVGYCKELSTQMLPCSICKEAGHPSGKCPELTHEIKEPSPPQPTGPRGQGEDDD